MNCERVYSGGRPITSSFRVDFRPEPAARSDGAAPPPGRLSTQQLVELLKMPPFVGEARRVVLDQLGNRYRRTFADVWEFPQPDRPRGPSARPEATPPPPLMTPATAPPSPTRQPYHHVLRRPLPPPHHPGAKNGQHVAPERSSGPMARNGSVPSPPNSDMFQFRPLPPPRPCYHRPIELEDRFSPSGTDRARRGCGALLRRMTRFRTPASRLPRLRKHDI
jgi:hypothetical protein